MARQPDMDKWAAAWNHLARGGSLGTSGLNKQIATMLKRLQVGGWTWDTVYTRVQTEPGGLAALVAEMDGVSLPPRPAKPAPAPKAPPAPKPPPPPRPEPPPKPPKPMPVAKPEPAPAKPEPPPEPEDVEEVPETALQPIRVEKPAPAPKRRPEHWKDRHHAKVLSQREHRERELTIGKNLLNFADRMLEVCSPYLQLKRKVSRRAGECPHCQKETVVEEIHIYPSKVDVQGIVRLYKEGAERIRIALNMPKNMLAIRVSDAQSEVAERLQDIDEAFKQAFRSGIERGLLTEQAAMDIWEMARSRIEGKRSR